MRILIAEDDRLSCTFLTEFLQEYGQCDTADNGLETIDKYVEALKNGEPYDLMCLDIMMPKVDGLMVLKIIRELESRHHVAAEKQARIIMMTAIADMDYVDQAFELGCDAYASKPIEIAQVQEVMQDLGLIS
ncbi:putative two-component system response regulator receiver protein [Selenomonas ruminantium subsp. lactilytica TAM6421]|uniref:Putative two-component system response regulator receiver protein n=1 Tax=Selenomonas ruminantium subsp. lactilytica (strain NBRC 103574 / TAM6421) TaxID=927704 RepID=I0GMN6_SELRL|nr:response regulator [Selenomonas ruminantium]BAL82023.1 putative two-component system response regulator receiver protein [Selenomonas ruminantium subsp. lactilytica TAM6421]